MTCEAKTKTGKKCSARPLEGKAYCFSHDPESTERRETARKAGGKARGAQLRRRVTTQETGTPSWLPLVSLDDARAAYAWLVGAVVSGRLEARTVNAAAGALGGLVAVIRDCDLEKRIAAIEERSGARK